MTQTCSATSRAREEPLTATASRVERWLLVEHRGAWGPQSVPTSRMPRALSRALSQTASAVGARLLLVRRPAGIECGPGRWVFSVDSRPGAEQVLARHVATDLELAGLDPREEREWESYDGTLYLVCTHGRHDRCCALRGRPVAQALSRAHPERTWESSHVGGDRFAANLVVLPTGLYLGQVEADEVVQVVADLEQGLLPAGHVRGRSSLPLPTQAAQQLARQALDRWRTGELVPVGQESVERDVWRVRLAHPDVEVVVGYDRTSAPLQQLTCGADTEQRPPVWRQVSLTEL